MVGIGLEFGFDGIRVSRILGPVLSHSVVTYGAVLCVVCVHTWACALDC